MRVLRHVRGVHAGVHPPRSRQVQREVDMRAVLGGGEGRGGEERSGAGQGPRHTYERVLEVQQAREDTAGPASGRGDEGDAEEVVEDGEVEIQ